MFRHGLVLGKFWPPTAGHLHLIDSAAAACETLSVLVMAASWEDLPLATRVCWLREHVASRPGVHVLGIHDDVRVDYADPQVWDAHMAVVALALGEAGRGAPDAVFTSESYGDELARRLGAAHVCVDLARATRPVSGTAARHDPVAVWELLAPPVRGWLARRVVVVGAESTGTTTMARALAAAYAARGGVWAATRHVPEYGRAFSLTRLLAARLDRPEAGPEDLAWDTADFLEIARFQAAEEEEAARRGSPVLFCDTDAAATAIWHERYVGRAEPALAAIAAALPPRDMYLLTDHAGVPFEQDGLRDGEHLRAWMTGRFREQTAASGVPTIVLCGPHEQRLAAAIAAVDAMLARPVWPERTARRNPREPGMIGCPVPEPKESNDPARAFPDRPPPP